MALHQMPNMPGAGVMTDTLDFVKSLWGSMGVPGINIPGIAAPTLSVDDLDKKINELKAVESWLNLNSTMLRSSIQALEVQRGTIAALKSMGQSLAASMAQSVPTPDKSPFASASSANASWPATERKAEAKPEPAAAAPAPEAEKPAEKPQAAADAATAAAQMANPAIWWNLLQEQFKQAVSTAMAPEPAKPAAPKANGDGNDKGNGAPAKPAASAASATTSAARKPAAKRPPKPPKNAN
ncbi:PhaM family polyhydroxyalkanoate granule multifunctional regulatory protein [Pseudoduganella sp. UC29_106]|uniref:PhaM family polyhydroxyalkanoate granule multifunctional regulatory protein n=1 Tax=Pseudoduganella sp. UC29_106 TaxID=3374553 RepID=UPI0037571F7A